jgi:flagellin
MSDITLSSGIRQNLLSLQNTAADLTTTQEHLATGKKVNTAFDNPSSYFTSQSLNNRASDLSALLDQIGQAQQTLNAANDGLTGLTSLLEQALSTAQQAQAATNDTAGATTGTVDLSSNSGAAATLLIATGGTTYTVSIAASAALSTIESDINNTAGLGSAGAVTASDDGSGHLILTSNNPSSSFTVSGTDQATFGLASTAVVGSSSTRTTLQGNYNSLLTQITQLAGDSSYNGINLIDGNNLTVNFNETATSTLQITGVTFNASGLGLSNDRHRRLPEHLDHHHRGNVDQLRDHHRPRPDRDVRHELLDDLDPSIVRAEPDQYAADRRQQPGPRRPEPGKRQPAHRANPAAAGNLGTVDRQPGESVGAQAVSVISSGTGPSGSGGAKAPPFFVVDGALIGTTAFLARH